MTDLPAHPFKFPCTFHPSHRDRQPRSPLHGHSVSLLSDTESPLGDDARDDCPFSPGASEPEPACAATVDIVESSTQPPPGGAGGFTAAEDVVEEEEEDEDEDDEDDDTDTADAGGDDDDEVETDRGFSLKSVMMTVRLPTVTARCWALLRSTFFSRGRALRPLLFFPGTEESESFSLSVLSRSLPARSFFSFLGGGCTGEYCCTTCCATSCE